MGPRPATCPRASKAVLESFVNSTVCTLTEGSYHFGVAILANSLYTHGFRGEIYVGFRGDLPAWAMCGEAKAIGSWSRAMVLDVASGLKIVFLRLNTSSHLTNYKPDFMLDLLDGPASDAEALFYFDPDIIVNTEWGYFRDWVDCGVALCEDVNSPLSENHPRRVGWRRFLETNQMPYAYKTSQYVNGGCIGVHRSQTAFLSAWKLIQERIAPIVGGSGVAKITMGEAFANKGFADCFDATDQDAMNIAIGHCDTECSILGQEAMGFEKGTSLLPHALGPDKPWERSYLKSSIAGIPPRTVDKLYWQAAIGPVVAHSRFTIKMKRIAIGFASLIGRFYARR